MLVPAPGLFSITTCWPQIRDSRSAVMRATVSVDPPGAYGTTMRTGRVGQSCASVGRLTAVASANAAASGHAAAAPPTVAMNSRLSIWIAMGPSGGGSSPCNGGTIPRFDSAVCGSFALGISDLAEGSFTSRRHAADDRGVSAMPPIATKSARAAKRREVPIA